MDGTGHVPDTEEKRNRTNAHSQSNNRKTSPFPFI
jgi:hypothetical protein